MIEGKQSVLDWFNSHEFNYWTIFNNEKSDSGNFFARYSNEAENASKTDAYNELSKALQFINRGKFKIVCTQGPKLSSRGKIETMFEITTSAAQLQPTPVLSGIPDGYISKTEIGSIVEESLNKYKQEVELKELKKQLADLQKENKELEKEATQPLNVIMGHIQPYLGAIIASIMPGVQKAVAGIPSEQTEQNFNNNQPLNMANEETAELQPEQLERLTTVVNKLAALSPQWLEILEKLSDKVTAKPALLNMIDML